MLYWLIYIASSFLVIYIFYKRFIYSCYTMQLEHYQIGRLLDWYYKNRMNKKLIIPLISSIVSMILVIVIRFYYVLFIEIVLSLVTLPYVNYRQDKNRLKLTNRMKRLLGFILFIVLLVFLITYLILNNNFKIEEIIYIYLLILNFLVVDLVIFGTLIAYPLEKVIQNKLINKARLKILENPRLQVIGITGSFGKTSTKFVVNKILQKEFFVYSTPQSYNTPMGITLSVNEYLKNITQVFVCEMGARRIGEIKELANIVFPKIGIITAIGPQHLETFGNVKNIISTKFELIESLPSDGLAILNYDNFYIRNYQVKNDVKIITYGIEQSNVDYYALNIHYGISGSTFEVQFPNKERYLFQTKLLGKHNISNILAGIALADYYKINIRKIINAVKELEPVKHRLELINMSNYCIIDDSFNANVEGSQNALDILNHFKNKKIIITPGLIELGDKQYEYNYNLGTIIAKVCDYVVLVGIKQTNPIYNALKDSHFPLDNIYITNEYIEGFNHIVEKFKENFTVLIENDLPDNYSE